MTDDVMAGLLAQVADNNARRAQMTPAQAAQDLREHIDIAVRTRYRCLSGQWLNDEDRASFVDLVAWLVASEIRRMADAAEHVTMVYDQDSDDGWREWMRGRAAAIDETCKD